jgi:hypothetical protein
MKLKRVLKWTAGAIGVACGPVEISLQLWLLIFGVNNERWKEQASKGMPASIAA